MKCDHLSSIICFGIILSFHGSFCLQWTSSGRLRDNIHLAACPGQAVFLNWDFATESGENVVDVEWRYGPNDGSAEILMATMVNGHFFTDALQERIQHIPGAGIRLLNVNAGNSGAYTVRVNVNQNGNIVTHTQTVHLVVTQTSVSPATHLTAVLQGARFVNETQDTNIILSCGPFDSTWASSLDVIWSTPTQQDVQSTFSENGQYYLAVPNPFISGEYSCMVDPNSGAGACINASSPIHRGASILLDGVQARLALMESQLVSLKQMLVTVQNEHDNLTDTIGDLRNKTLNGPTTATDIRLVNGSNIHNGRLEILHNGVWGTVCDDNFGVNDAKVACRQLGYPTSNPVAHGQAYFGQNPQLGIILDEVNCNGNEMSLQNECRHNTFGSNDCEHSEDVGVSCQ